MHIADLLTSIIQLALLILSRVAGARANLPGLP